MGDGNVKPNRVYTDMGGRISIDIVGVWIVVEIFVLSWA